MKSLRRPKKILFPFLSATMLMLIFSCQKEKTIPPKYEQGGVFLIDNYDFFHIWPNGDTTNQSTSSIWVFFTDPKNGNYVDGGEVRLNGFMLEKSPSYGYSLSGNTDTFGLSSGTNWNITGSNSLQGFSYNGNAFSPFQMNLPTEIIRTKDLEINVITPSGFIVSYGELKINYPNGGSAISKSFESNIGKIKISVSELSNLDTVNNWSAAITIDLTQRAFHNVGNKVYEFHHTRSISRPVNIY